MKNPLKPHGKNPPCPKCFAAPHRGHADGQQFLIRRAANKALFTRKKLGTSEIGRFVLAFLLKQLPAELMRNGY